MAKYQRKKRNSSGVKPVMIASSIREWNVYARREEERGSLNHQPNEIERGMCQGWLHGAKREIIHLTHQIAEEREENFQPNSSKKESWRQNQARSANERWWWAPTQASNTKASSRGENNDGRSLLTHPSSWKAGNYLKKTHMSHTQAASWKWK